MVEDDELPSLESIVDSEDFPYVNLAIARTEVDAWSAFRKALKDRGINPNGLAHGDTVVRRWRTSSRDVTPVTIGIRREILGTRRDEDPS
jgi:hypothetical protein